MWCRVFFFFWGGGVLVSFGLNWLLYWWWVVFFCLGFVCACLVWFLFSCEENVCIEIMCWDHVFFFRCIFLIIKCSSFLGRISSITVTKTIRFHLPRRLSARHDWSAGLHTATSESLVFLGVQSFHQVNPKDFMINVHQHQH